MTEIDFDLLWSEFDIARQLVTDDGLSQDRQLPTGEERKKTPAEALVQNWLERRTQIYGKTGLDSFHICTYDTCVQNEYIQEIDKDMRLYGCVVGGAYHFCEVNTASCPNTMLHTDGTIMCVFSGFSIGVLLDNRLYGKPETGMNMYNEEQVERSREQDPGNYVLEDWVDSSEKRRRKKRRKCVTNFNPSSVKHDVRLIVLDLLYNKKERVRIDQKRVDEMRESGDNAVRKYYKKCKREHIMPLKHRVETIFSNHMNTKRRLKPLQVDVKRINCYTEVIANLWKIIIETEYCKNNSSKFHLRQHVIGTLYVMQMPFFFEGDTRRRLLPGDNFLYRELPHQNDLKEWQSSYEEKKGTYAKKDVTKGRNNLKDALNSIVDDEKRLSVIECIENLLKAIG